ncbi:YraN family protein [Candidatus Poribacteria bacterium]|nr:YraN family protein [Candidatus Poribacteria bacterium]MYG06457.1 YraN family protein [Candidatus Poribacteria bacterium]MYK24954.1 YraN family protein [Candidatus Poribacteria bacterium]
MAYSRLDIAKTGESLAVAHLKARGYDILERNYRALRGEIDLIAQDGEFIVFVEVKTRRSLKFGLPQTAVTTQKQQQISKVALAYLQAKNLFDTPCRFDVIAIHLSPEFELLKLEQIESAFDFQTKSRF